MFKTTRLILGFLILSSLSLGIVTPTLADDDPKTSDMSTTECKAACEEAFDICKNDDTKDTSFCRQNRTACKDNCSSIGGVNASTGLQGEELIDSLVPNQGTLFGNDENIKLTTGDLEQELAPRLLKILVQFSSLLGFILFTYLGIKLVLSRSDETAYTETKAALIHTFVGAVIIAGSFGIVLAILQIFNSL